MTEHPDPADLAELALEGRAVDEAPPPVREHLRACAGCRNELDELRRLVGAVRTATSSDLVGPPPPGVWDRLAHQARVGRKGRQARKARQARQARKARKGEKERKDRKGQKGCAGRVFAADADGMPMPGGRTLRRRRLAAAVLLAAGLAAVAARCALRWTRRRRPVREDPLRRRA
ncbi:hypothetical protein [Streptomyces pacificus]|uniref:Zinc-finger domain-containing protein n=1 Tax=Streptomyces pacificus TaxID=2705029 RepID=A0A6A0AZV7_9ACTN|nr:hypothetical protein [Streptomyces pacificus]GFH37514.1 hypothetical protein SCWH03_37520 [Streptomyces pacificus]